VQGLLEVDGSLYYPSIKELEEAHGVSLIALRKKMIEGNWILKREQWQLHLHKWIHAASMENYIAAAQKFDQTCVTVAQQAMDAILHHISEKIKEGELPASLDLDRLGRAAVNWQKVGRLSLGLSTENNMLKTQQTLSEQTTTIDTTLLSEQEVQLLEAFVSKSEFKNAQQKMVQTSEDMLE
jgi:hypothetical protein